MVELGITPECHGCGPKSSQHKGVEALARELPREEAGMRIVHERIGGYSLN